MKVITGDVLHYACHVLQKSQSRSSSDKEKELFAGLVHSCTSRAARLASADQTSYGRYLSQDDRQKHLNDLKAAIKVSVELSIR